MNATRIVRIIIASSLAAVALAACAHLPSTPVTSTTASTAATGTSAPAAAYTTSPLPVQNASEPLSHRVRAWFTDYNIDGQWDTLRADMYNTAHGPGVLSSYFTTLSADMAALRAAPVAPDQELALYCDELLGFLSDSVDNGAAGDYAGAGRDLSYVYQWIDRAAERGNELTSLPG